MLKLFNIMQIWLLKVHCSIASFQDYPLQHVYKSFPSNSRREMVSENQILQIVGIDES